MAKDNPYLKYKTGGAIERKVLKKYGLGSFFKKAGNIAKDSGLVLGEVATGAVGLDVIQDSAYSSDIAKDIGTGANIAGGVGGQVAATLLGGPAAGMALGQAQQSLGQIKSRDEKSEAEMAIRQAAPALTTPVMGMIGSGGGGVDAQAEGATDSTASGSSSGGTYENGGKLSPNKIIATDQEYVPTVERNEYQQGGRIFTKYTTTVPTDNGNVEMFADLDDFIVNKYTGPAHKPGKERGGIAADTDGDGKSDIEVEGGEGEVIPLIDVNGTKVPDQKNAYILSKDTMDKFGNDIYYSNQSNSDPVIKAMSFNEDIRLQKETEEGKAKNGGKVSKMRLGGYKYQEGGPTKDPTKTIPDIDYDIDQQLIREGDIPISNEQTGLGITTLGQAYDDYNNGVKIDAGPALTLDKKKCGGKVNKMKDGGSLRKYGKGGPPYTVDEIMKGGATRSASPPSGEGWEDITNQVTDAGTSKYWMKTTQLPQFRAFMTKAPNAEGNVVDPINPKNVYDYKFAPEGTSLPAGETTEFAYNTPQDFVSRKPFEVFTPNNPEMDIQEKTYTPDTKIPAAVAEGPSGSNLNLGRALSTAAPGLLGAYFSSKLDPALRQVAAPRVNLAQIDPTRAIAEARTSEAGYRDMISQRTGGGRGLANIQALGASTGEGIADIATKYENINKDIINRERMTNFQSAQQANAANLAAQREYDRTKLALEADKYEHLTNALSAPVQDLITQSQTQAAIGAQGIGTEWDAEVQESRFNPFKPTKVKSKYVGSKQTTE